MHVHNNKKKKEKKEKNRDKAGCSTGQKNIKWMTEKIYK